MSTDLITSLASSPTTLDTFTQYIDPDSPEYDIHLAVAQIPSLFGASDMATYLGYRALGLTPTQALAILDMDPDVYSNWFDRDSNLAKFEREALPLIQKHCANEIIRLGFLRNTALSLAQDQRTLMKAMLVGLDELSPREYTWLKTIRRHYTNSDLLAIQKVIDPETYKAEESIQINVSWGNQHIQEVIEVKELPSGSDTSS